MTRKVLPLGAVMMCLAGVPSISAPVPKEGTAIGVDIGATAAGAFVHAVAATFALELPLSGGWAVSLEPSFYTATGTDAWILQINAAALARWYPFSGPAHWGPVLAAGAVAAWECTRGGLSVSVLALGPAVRAGYRVVFGEAGVFLEPSVGFMALFGGRFATAGVSSSANAGVTLGMTVGWRF